MTNYYMGIDCGGTFIKAGVYDAQGTEIAVAKQSLEVLSPKPGYAERDLTQLQTALFAVMLQARTQAQERVPELQIAAIGISAQGKGLFALDKEGKPVGNGILSSDQRSLPVVQNWLKSDFFATQVRPKTAQTLWTGHPVSILAALKQQEPERYAQIAHVLMSHDYLRYVLTGKLGAEITNISESNMYNMATETYDRELLVAFGIEDKFDALVPVVGSAQVVGHLTPQVAAATGMSMKTAVVGGLFDVVSTALCAGVQEEQELNVVLGTWTVVTGISPDVQRSQEHGLVYGKHCIAGKNVYHEASPTSAGNLEWVKKQIAPDLSYDQINQLVADCEEHSVFFVPFLYGSNAGLGMQGAFYGLQTSHERRHLFSAAYQGVLFSMMHHYERMLKGFTQVQLLKVTGGPAHSQVWMQMLADLTGKRLCIPEVNETGCLGAALMAMVGAGAYSSVEQARGAIATPVRFVEPQENQALQAKYQNYKLLVQKLAEFNTAKA